MADNQTADVLDVSVLTCMNSLILEDPQETIIQSCMIKPSNNVKIVNIRRQNTPVKTSYNK